MPVGSATVLPYTFTYHEHTALVYAYDCDGCTFCFIHVVAKVRNAIISVGSLVVVPTVNMIIHTMPLEFKTSERSDHSCGDLLADA